MSELLGNSQAKFESHNSSICERYVLQEPQVSHYSANRKSGPHTYFIQAPFIVFANLALVSSLLLLRTANIAFHPKKLYNHLAALILFHAGH